MDNKKLAELIRGNFGKKVSLLEDQYGMLNVEISREDVKDLVEWLKFHAELSMDFMTDLCGIHYPENDEKELGVVIHLHSFIHNLRLRVKSFFPIADPTFPSMTPLYAAANWMERETFDFYGIVFTGHPDLKRILNIDSMDYFPMRKEYALEDETRTDKTDSFFGR